MSTATVNDGIRPRRKQVNYLNIPSAEGEKFVLLGRGFTELNESPSAQTSSKRYVNMASSSQSVTGYDAGWGFNADQIRAEEAIAYICNIGEERKTGADAETDMIIVDLDRPIENSTTEFYARKQRVAIAVSDFGDEDGEMTCEGDLLGVGDLVVGSFNTASRTFTEGGAVAGGGTEDTGGTDNGENTESGDETTDDETV